MSSHIEARWLICRICLKNTTSQLYAIFEDEGREALAAELGNLQEKIELYGGIEIYPQNNMPNKICSRCLLLLRAAHSFRDLCQQSQLQLKQFIHSPKRQTEDEDNLLASADEANEDDTLIDHNINSEIEKEYLTDDREDVDIIQQEHLEDDEQYIFERHNDSSQDNQQLMLEDSNSFSNMDHVQIEYYNEGTDEAIASSKYNDSMVSEESNDQSDEVYIRPIKKKRRLAENSEYKCSLCKNVYLEKSKYMLHMKMHKNVKPHECEICGKRFSTTPQLSRHMNSHTGNRPYKCQYCDACFGDPSTKIKHERIHTNERPYKCNICNKSFAYSNVLKVHMMIHTGEKPHACAYCKKCFSQVHHKNAHEKRHLTTKNLGPDELDFEEEMKKYVMENN